MFGLKKKIWLKQMRRAVAIENCILLGISKYLMASNGYDADRNKPSDHDLALFIGTAHWVIGLSIENQVEKLGDDKIARERIRESVNRLFSADEMLEKLVVRLLYEIASISMMLKKDVWTQEYTSKHLRMMEILTAARPKWPELFRDANESLFKGLFADFINKYMPNIRTPVSEMFL